MANTIQQYRFYEKNSSKNYMIEDVKDLVTGDFLGEKIPVIQLGVQALEGTRIYLNNLVNPIIIGESGIFELELDGVTEIFKIRFDCASLDAINKDKNATLIIDTIYISQEQGG